MAPAAGQKGTGKKNNPINMQKSRNSTPAPASSLPPQEVYDPDFLSTRVILFRNLTYDDLVDQGASNATVPDSKSIDVMLEKLKSLANIMEKRSTFYDRGMRLLAEQRKNISDDYDTPRAEGESEKRIRKRDRKRASDSLAPPEGNIGMMHRIDDYDPHAYIAFAEQSSPLRDAKRKHSRDNDSASSSLSPVGPTSPSAMEVDEKKKKGDKAEENDDESSEDEGAPPPREIPQSQTFGEDPSTFPDPTVYEIRDVVPGMSEQEIKEIYSVATYPKSDLADLIAGDPPDKDFSSAKPTSQINYSTFVTYTDPYFRPFTEEDAAFLRERGDRLTPFVMPKRGKRHYSEIWAEEDGAMAIDTPQQGREKLPANQPRGNIENMNDSVAETDGLSIGPLASRLLLALRVEGRAQTSDDKPATNGDVSMNGDTNAEEQNGIVDDKNQPVPPATYMPESSTEAWKKASHPKLEYAQVDERLKQELRYLGFLPQEGFDADYDGQFDDEIAGRLRVLQARLKEQMLINGASKARLAELVKERMAHQEYQTILEDLDTQVQAAYLKRTRTMGKSKKTKRPGGAGGGSHVAVSGMARPGIGDLTKTLMERRRRWIDTIGSVFDDESLGKVPRASNPNSSIFKPEDMKELLKKEQELLDEEIDEE
jgi:transcriptional adapter 3